MDDVLRRAAGSTAPVTLTATADGLKPATATFK